MHDYLMAEDSELWDIVLDGPFVPMMEERMERRPLLFQSLGRNMTKLTGKRLKRVSKLKLFWSVG